jgi:hypothetical protein
LEEALALQEITTLRQGAQNQQAMQAGGAQPSVVEKLRQMLSGIQQQAQMAQAPQPTPQGQPVMAARGGSIDQLMSNLGRYYAGGGIVAFKEGDEVEDPDAGNRPLLERLLYANISPAEKGRRRRLALQAAAGQTVPAQQESPNANMGSLIEKLLYSNTTPVEQQRRAALQTAADERGTAPVDGFQQQTGPKENMGSLIERLLYSNLSSAEQRRRAALQAASDERAGISNESATPTAAVDMGREGSRTSPVAMGNGTNVSPNLIPASARPQPAPAAPRPPTANVNAPAAPAALDPNSLRGLTEAYIKGEFGLSPETERDKAVEFAKRTMGLDALLGEKERRANEREASIKQAQGERMPAWVEALAAAGKPVRGGLGTLLGQMGGQAQATREAYQTQDLKYQAELAQLRDVITDAKIAGNKDLVKEGMAAYKEIDARRRAAATNATSLVKTDEDTEMRKEIAKGRIAGAAASAGAAANAKNMANAINAVKNDEVINRLQKDADALSKSFLPKDKAKLADVARQIETRQNAIYKQFGVLEGLSTIAAAPGAGSPGGTTRMRFDAQGNPIK